MTNMKKQETLTNAAKFLEENKTRKTRQSEFLERYPETVVDEEGIVCICPRYFSASLRDSRGRCKCPKKSCGDCMLEYWTQEIE